MPTTALSYRRKRGLSQAKAKKIAKEGLKSAGDGFHSEKQKNFVGLVAGGGTPTRTKPKMQRLVGRRRKFLARKKRKRPQIVT
jgi:hypothetical protein